MPPLIHQMNFGPLINLYGNLSGGFYIAKITVTEPGGSIDVESVVGEGTVFTLRLPVVKNSSLNGE